MALRPSSGLAEERQQRRQRSNSAYGGGVGLLYGSTRGSSVGAADYHSQGRSGGHRVASAEAGRRSNGCSYANGYGQPVEEAGPGPGNLFLRRWGQQDVAEGLTGKAIGTVVGTSRVSLSYALRPEASSASVNSLSHFDTQPSPSGRVYRAVGTPSSAPKQRSQDRVGLWAERSAPQLGTETRRVAARASAAMADRSAAAEAAQRKAKGRKSRRAAVVRKGLGRGESCPTSEDAARERRERLERERERERESQRDPLAGLPAGLSRANLEEAQRKAADQADSGLPSVRREQLSEGGQGQVAQLLDAMVRTVAMAEVGLSDTVALETHQAACFAAEAVSSKSGRGKAKGAAPRASSTRGSKQLREQQQRQSARLSASRRVDGAVPTEMAEQAWVKGAEHSMTPHAAEGLQHFQAGDIYGAPSIHPPTDDDNCHQHLQLRASEQPYEDDESWLQQQEAFGGRLPGQRSTADGTPLQYPIDYAVQHTSKA